MPSIIRPMTAFARKAFKPKKSAEKSLTRKLHTVERVHPAPRFSCEGEYTDYTERGRDYLYLRHILDEINGDGLWKCCRGHEQELIHWKGSHPFKRLRCNSCDHILCPHCETTTVLTCLEGGRVLPDKCHGVSGLVSYGQLCPSCGLTHRARRIQSTTPRATTLRKDTDDDEKVTTKVTNNRTLRGTTIRATTTTTVFDNVLCVCGRLADPTWLRFWIGPIYEYRGNPHDAFAHLSRQRAESSIRRHRERRRAAAAAPPPTPPPPRPETSSSLLPYGSSSVSRASTDSNASVLSVHWVAQWSSVVSLATSSEWSSGRWAATPWTVSSVSLGSAGLGGGGGDAAGWDHVWLGW